MREREGNQISIKCINGLNKARPILYVVAVLLRRQDLVYPQTKSDLHRLEDSFKFKYFTIDHTNY